MTSTTIAEVGSGATPRDFARVPWRLHHLDPRWVAPLPGETRRMFDPRLQPTLRPGRWTRWVLERNGSPVGRIAAFAPAHRPGVGYFGFFDADRDPAAAEQLLGVACEWLTGKGCTEVHGPVPVTARDGIGFLVGGDDGPPAYGCPWNPAYYLDHVESAGFSPTITLRSYRWIPGDLDNAHLDQMTRRAETSPRIRVRPIDPRQLRTETRTITALINETLAAAWHYEPVSEAEADALAGQLRQVIDPAMVLLAEDPDGPCAVALAVPDLNWLWHRAGNRLWPRGWWSLLTARNRVPHLRVLVLGVAARHRGSSVAARLLHVWTTTAKTRGYRSAELAQVFDTNHAMCHLLDRRGLELSRRYAVYSRSLPPYTRDTQP